MGEPVSEDDFPAFREFAAILAIEAGSGFGNAPEKSQFRPPACSISLTGKQGIQFPEQGFSNLEAGKFTYRTDTFKIGDNVENSLTSD